MLTLPKLLRKPLPPKIQPKPLDLKKEKLESAIPDAKINQQSKQQDLQKPHPSKIISFELEKIIISRKLPKRRKQSRIHIKNLLLKWHLKRFRDTAPKMFLKKYPKFYMLFSSIKEDYGGPFYIPTRDLIRHSVSKKSSEQWISSKILTPTSSSTFIKHDLERVTTPDSEYEHIISSSRYMDKSMYNKGKMDWYERLRIPQNTITNKIFSFDELPATLPRRPYTNITLEMSQNKGKKSKLKKSLSSEKIISFPESIPEKSESEEEFIVCGEGYYKKPLSLSDKTKMKLARIAVKRCHDHSKNALSLKGFFIERCPGFGILTDQLVYLNLAFNSLSIFPPEVFALINLQVLIMRNNPIKEIPSEIEELKYLTIFIISFNLLTFLPKGIFSLSKLEFLDVSYNEITSIPKDIQNLRSLKILNLDGNELTSLPPEIVKLFLDSLSLENNYTHPLLWKENSKNDVQRLKDLVLLTFFHHQLWELYKEVLPFEIKKLQIVSKLCDYCHGPIYGKGLRLIRPYNLFNNPLIPILFEVCSPRCYQMMSSSPDFFDSILKS